MKIYISLPITGNDIKKVEERCNAAKEKIKSKGHDAISPLDLCNGDYSKPYSYYIGIDLQSLLECDAVLFLDGYQNSKGCTLELAAAHIYGKKRFFEDDF